MIVVDDHYVATSLAEGALDSTAVGIATTCSWWWRLTSALASFRSGALSRHFARLDQPSRSALLQTVQALPTRLVIVDIRELIPAMATLSAQYTLNQLAAEAIVAAEVLDAELLLAVDTPKIRDTASARGLIYRLA